MTTELPPDGPGRSVDPSGSGGASGSGGSPGSGGLRPGSGSGAKRQPSLVPGTVLLGIAAALIALVLVKPDMPSWLRTVIAVAAVVVVVALLAIAFMVFRGTTRRNR